MMLFLSLLGLGLCLALLFIGLFRSIRRSLQQLRHK